MIARVRKLISDAREAFWVVPAAMVLASIFVAFGLVYLDRSGILPKWLLEGWLYNGGPTGARTLLGAIASSAIGVAGTVFSITIAALSLAAGQMGPRLLRNFTRDRGNQFALGVFVSTFAYALMVLRTIRTTDEGQFVPHLSLTIGILLAFVCIATLVWFVAHMAGRINVDTVIDLVSDDLHCALEKLKEDGEKEVESPASEYWDDAVQVIDPRSGYLQQLDQDGLADWAAENGAAIRLLVREGDYVFPSAPIALVKPDVEDVKDAIRRATALGSQRRGALGIDYSTAQLVEVALRALSPGVNDPYTAMVVLDRLGAALCELAALELPNGVVNRNNRCVLLVPTLRYEELLDATFDTIRHHSKGTPAILSKLLEVLTKVAACEHSGGRLASLKLQARLVLDEAERALQAPRDIAQIRLAYARFERVAEKDGVALATRG